MNQKQHNTSAHTLRFRRWSRKGYAAFVSLHHTVNIGQLASRLADRFHVKQNSLHAAVLAANPSVDLYTEKEEEAADKECFPVWQEFLLWLTAGANIQTVSVSSDLLIRFQLIQESGKEPLMGSFPLFFMS
ncbi:hypothetical protein LJC44_04250 [Parabacteroides sp. OttesenSCG-928-G06]|nr:hypothetical protein [Parabacteroides sp. OttesenSCG-928-K15]MDL2282308.1 hypothetical protein [Parabacteroides sp. OttesenSCG-928-G06]